LVASWGGGLGVVGIDAAVCPPDGACTTPGAFELPQAARPADSTTSAQVIESPLIIDVAAA
jgi:hypothetical protein